MKKNYELRECKKIAICDDKKEDRSVLRAINKMSDADRAALVKQLKADQANREQKFTSLVHKMMYGQAKTYGYAEVPCKWQLHG